jgi:hypothetical protein
VIVADLDPAVTHRSDGLTVCARIHGPETAVRRILHRLRAVVTDPATCEWPTRPGTTVAQRVDDRPGGRVTPTLQSNEEPSETAEFSM